MNRSRNSKYVLGVIIGVIIVSTPIILMMLPAQEPPTEIKLPLLFNAGIMIDVEGVWIYIDPSIIPSNYSDLPADEILVRHQHGDYYSRSDIEDILSNLYF